MDAWQIALVSTIGVCAGLVALRSPRMFLAAACLAVLSSPTLVVVTGISRFALTDDALVLAAFVYLPFVRLAQGQKLRGLPGIGFFVLVVVCGLAGAFHHQVGTSIALSGAFLLMKGPMLGFAVAQVDWSERDIRRLSRYITAFLFLLVGCAVANIVAPVAWSAIFSSSGTPDYRGSIVSVIGPFTVPSFFGQVTGLCAVALFVFNQQFGSKSRAVTVLGFLAAVLTFRRKTFVALPLAVIAVFGIKRKAELILFGLPLALIALIVFWTPVSATVTETRQEYFGGAAPAPRILMYQGSEDIARRDFPLGAGFGRWASDVALKHYSPEYLSRGFFEIDGLGPNSTHNYATDTFWPIVIGETGFGGLLCYWGALIAMFRRFRLAIRRGSDAEKSVGMVGVGWFVLLLFESLAAPVFTGPPVYPWLFVVAGVLVGLSAHPSSDDDERAPTEPRASGAAASDELPRQSSKATPAAA